MKKAVASDTTMPPGGWKLTVPETGVTVTAPYANALHKRVNAHRQANGLPTIDPAEFEDAACTESGHGAPWCSGVTGPVKAPTTMHRVRRFLRTMKVVVQERKFVSTAERERRMAICMKCPLLTIEGLGCHNCVEDLRAVEKEVGELPPGNVLSCSACGCLVALKSAIANESLDRAEETEEIKYHESCWRLGH